MSKRAALPFKVADHYSNILLLAPDGQALATIPAKRARWYKKRNLVEVVANQEGYNEVLRLLVEPAGRPNKSPTPLVNQCVVCGDTAQLSSHHVIPKAIRSFFPDEHKMHLHQWCVLVCEQHHLAAEKVARVLYEKPLQEATSQVHQNYSRLCSGVIKDCWREKKQLSQEELSLYQEIRRIAVKFAQKESAEKIINEFGGIEKTVEEFTKAFMTLEPRFLPDGFCKPSEREEGSSNSDKSNSQSESDS